MASGMTRSTIFISHANPEDNEFARFLATLGYPYWEESANPVYRLFLA